MARTSRVHGVVESASHVAMIGAAPSRCRASAVAIAMIAASSSAVAHPIAVNRGIITVFPDRIVAELRMSGEDLLHNEGPSHRPARLSSAWLRHAFEGQASRLVRTVVLRDEAGERMPGVVVESELEGVRDAELDVRGLGDVRASYTIEYRASCPQRFLTFRQETLDAPTGLPTQFALLVRQPAALCERTIRLSSGGNSETLEFDWTPRDGLEAASEGDALQTHFSRHRFDAVQAIIHVVNDGLRIEIHVPLPLLETWIRIERDDPDHVLPDEQDQATAGLREFFMARNTFRLNDQTLSPQILEIGFLAPDETAINARAQRRRLGTWTARVGVVLDYRISESLKDIRVDWDLFNNAVLAADVLIIDGASTELHQFSTYAPSLRFERH